MTASTSEQIPVPMGATTGWSEPRKRMSNTNEITMLIALRTNIVQVKVIDTMTELHR